jgi:N-methylhydantoinase A
MTAAMPRFAVAVDTGGTFTDFVLLDRVAGTAATVKVLSTPGAPDDAIIEGFDQLARRHGFEVADCDVFLHATTVITNAVIERRGHDFILCHTEGFGTTLETGRENRYNLSNLRLAFPQPITRHCLKIPVRERVLADGSVSREPDKAALLDAARPIVEATGVTNFAVCFLHAFRNPVNEQVAGAWLAEAFPGATVSLSSAVAPLQREYERWMTCAVNAYTKPLLANYVGRLERRASALGFSGRLLLMTSSGLPLAADRCAQWPVRLIESGPAAGVLAAQEIAERNGFGQETVLAYDMGGTTAKGAFITGGRPRVQPGLEVAREGAFEPGSGFPLLIPAIDLIEIGAGGGSIAEIDERGAIAVGPRSAGAAPGPACYGRGGRNPTVTDANLALGLLGEANFRNSGITVSTAPALEAIGRAIAGPLGLPLAQAALGIHRTVNENVARAFRVHAAELGLDYRRAILVCTGGSAPLHAASVARLLHISRVVFPFAAGVASAFGLFASSEGIVLQQSRRVSLDALPEGAIERQAADMVRSDPYAESMVGQGAKMTVKLGMRYEGQNSEVTLSLGEGGAIPSVDCVRRRFLAAYKGIFGLSFPEFAIEISTWFVDVAMPAQLASARGFGYQALEPCQAAAKGSRLCHLGDAGQTDVPVFDRYAIGPGWTIDGPALIEEHDTTIFIPRDMTARVAPGFDLIAEQRP